MNKKSRRCEFVLFFCFLLVSWYILFKDRPPPPPPPLSSHPVIPYEIITENLELPWSIAFLPNGNLLVTEKYGILKQIAHTQDDIDIVIGGVYSPYKFGQQGLLGLALSPEFVKNKQIYVYFTHRKGDGTENRVERFILSDGILSDRKIIIDNIPSGQVHNGGRIAFGPDKYLYVTTGDTGKPYLAQDKESLAGKILRVTEDGMPAPGNPYGTLIYSMGHRNPQGLAWDKYNKLWSTEHGSRGNDEINIIEKGGNYGWPHSEGDRIREGHIAPVQHSGKDTWAPGGTTFAGERLFFGGLLGEALYEYVDDTLKPIEHFKSIFGRIRVVRYRKGEDALYIATSNEEDNKIIKVYLDALNE